MLSVVVVNYNAGPGLAANLGALAEALAGEAWEALVVDNDSQDGSMAGVEALAARGLPIRALYNGANLGFAAGCNIGARAGSGDWLLFLNPDVRVPPGTIEAVREALLADPGAALAGCLLRNPDGTEQRGCRRDFPDPRRSFNRVTGLSRLDPARFPDFNRTGEALPDRPLTVDAVSGAFMLVRRGPFEAIGGWDEGYFLHMEDLDLCRRLEQTGHRVLFVPQVSATHDQGTCSRTRPIWVERHKHVSMWRFYRRFDAAVNPWWLNGLVAVGIAAHLLLRAGRLLLSRH